jgi:hypothetical protein
MTPRTDYPEYPPTPVPVGLLTTPPITWELDNLTFGAEDDDGVVWYVTASDGWFGPPKPKTQRQAKFQTAGSFRNLAPRGERIIVLTGKTRCPDVLTRLDALDRFAACASNPAVVYDMTVTDQTGRPRTIGVELDAATDVKLKGPLWFDWQLTLGCPDPRKHDSTWQQPACGPPISFGGPGADFSGAGLDFSGDGLDWGTPDAPQSVSVTNWGTATAYPVLQLTGPFTNPTITDLTGGIPLTYAGSGVFGDTVTINCDQFAARGFPSQSVYFNGTSSRRAQLVIPQGWPQVGPGETRTYQFTADNTNPATTTLTAYLRAAWI